MRVNVAPLPGDGDGLRSRLQLQCADGQVLDVTHEEAMMSSTLWTLLQDVTGRRAGRKGARARPAPPARHLLPVADVPSDTVELALDYCRCLYQQQVERADAPMREWEETFFELDSKTLCDLAKVASNLDIQPLVDLTCRSIAQIMSATEAADELRHKFGLEDPPPHDATCNCQEMRADTAAGFDFDVLNALDHDISTEEYEFVELEQPSVDELLDFINGDANHPTGSGKPGSKHKKKGGSVDTASDAGNEGSTPGSAGKKKKKAKKKKKKKATTAHTASSTVSSQPSGQDEDDDEDDEAQADDDAREDDSTSDEDARAAELTEKMRLARLNPSAVFLESQFEDDSDEEMDEQLESFRLALESAYVDSRKTAARRPRLDFAPQDVFRSTGGRSSQRLASTVGSS